MSDGALREPTFLILAVPLVTVLLWNITGEFTADRAITGR